MIGKASKGSNPPKLYPGLDLTTYQGTVPGSVFGSVVDKGENTLGNGERKPAQAAVAPTIHENDIV